MGMTGRLMDEALPEITPEQARNAALTVAERCDRDAAREVIEALDLRRLL